MPLRWCMQQPSSFNREYDWKLGSKPSFMLEHLFFHLANKSQKLATLTKKNNHQFGLQLSEHTWRQKGQVLNWYKPAKVQNLKGFQRISVNLCLPWICPHTSARAYVGNVYVRDKCVTYCTAGHLIKKYPGNFSHSYDCITCSLISLPDSVWHFWLLNCFKQHHLYFKANLSWKYFLPPPTKEMEFPQKLYLHEVQERQDEFWKLWNCPGFKAICVFCPSEWNRKNFSSVPAHQLSEM